MSFNDQQTTLNAALNYLTFGSILGNMFLRRCLYVNRASGMVLRHLYPFRVKIPNRRMVGMRVARPTIRHCVFNLGRKTAT